MSDPGKGRPKDLPGVIGGYRVLRELGRDRAGRVFLARHRATGCAAALTTLKPEWACLPGFVSRLAHDVLAARLLEHPNLARIVAFGEDRGVVYAATESIDGGRTLADRIQEQGPLPPREAVALVLQAARGLMFAHGQGLVHGDLGPGDIVVDAEGIVRVSGLGLLQTPESIAAEDARATRAPIPLGNPAPAPADAVRTAALADLHGLGRTLYHLLAGSPPRDREAARIAPELIARGIPANLAEVVATLVDDRPGHGHADFPQGVAALERLLNARGSGTTAPREEHSRRLLEQTDAFRASPAAKRRRQILSAATAGWAVLVLLSLLGRQPRVAAGFLALGLATALASFVIEGSTRRTELFTRLRALVLESRGDWLGGLAAIALVLMTLVVLHLHWAYLGFTILGVLLALGLHVEIDRKVEAERRGAVAEARALLKDLRLQGVGEETLRRFVRNTAGDDEDAFFEAVFGAEAARAARAASDQALRALLRRRSLPWRDWALAWIDAVQEPRRQARETALLQAIEERALVAAGVNLVTARRKAWRIAEALVAVSAELRASGNADGSASPSTAGPTARLPAALAIRQAVEDPEHVLASREHGPIGPQRPRAWEWLLGPRLRFLLGTTLCAGFLLWVDQNGIVNRSQLQNAAARAIEHSDPLRALSEAKIDVHVPTQTKPLDLAFLPRPVANLFQGVNSGAAGLILIVSALVGGARAGLFALVGAALALLGPAAGLPRIGPLDSSTASMVIGASVALVGMFLGRSRGG